MSGQLTRQIEHDTEAHKELSQKASTAIVTLTMSTTRMAIITRIPLMMVVVIKLAVIMLIIMMMLIMIVVRIAVLMMTMVLLMTLVMLVTITMTTAMMMMMMMMMKVMIMILLMITIVMIWLMSATMGIALMAMPSDDWLSLVFTCLLLAFACLLRRVARFRLLWVGFAASACSFLSFRLFSVAFGRFRLLVITIIMIIIAEGFY